ncbi:MAG: LemA family protein [Pseudomonadales bacterium]|jgi:LemA protein|nr:LemA family protein [Pseudomonadales bacterium]MCP5320209.1 LemA family protein [Pseudomonadales bacterium]MCP5337756.1 LemA family protein [Pseudomonadales bacterium]
MGIAAIAVLAIVVLAAVYAVMLYNGLVQLKHNVTRAWANIDVLLRQRHDELPKLVETCKQYMQYEQETLTKVMEARSRVQAAQASGDMRSLGQAEGGLRSTVGRLFALAEAYPELKANQTFQQLQTRISALEDAIADRREFYNESVNLNNIRIEQFPDVLIARRFGFKAAELLEFTAPETADVDIGSLFRS